MKSKTAIFSILDSPALGGAESYLLSNLESLAKKNFSIHLATINKNIINNYQDKFSAINLPYRLDIIGNIKGLIKFFIQAPFAIIWLIKNLLELKKRYQQVIVYTPGFTERLIFSPFIKLLGIKLIWLEYGPVEAVFNRNFGLPKLIYHLTSNFPDKVITISRHSRSSLLKNTSIPKEKISIIYPGVPQITIPELDKFKKMGLSWKKEKKLNSKKLITFIGRLAIEKEVDLLLKAFAKLKQKKTHLVIIGDGPEKKAYSKLAKKLGIETRVLFSGFISEVEKKSILAISDIFVFPSAWKMEGFGITTIEAMMANVPVITTGFGPQKEIVSDNKSGLFFKSGNSNDLNKKMSLLLSSSQLANKLSDQGRKVVLKTFKQSLMLRQTLELILSQCD